MYKKVLVYIFIVASMLTGCTQNDSHTEVTLKKKVKVVCHKNTNYAYHMLSVAKCVYDNEYGERYAILHDKEDLGVLKKNEKLLMCVGGEYSGELFAYFIGIPSLLGEDINLKLYYNELAQLNWNKGLELLAETDYDSQREFFRAELEAFLKDESNKKIFVQIAEVFRDNYDIYIKEIWTESQKDIEVVAQRMNKTFSEKDYISEWENILGYEYPYEQFEVILCNSIENGPEAMNIFDKDIFQIPKEEEYNAKIDMISHEIGIFNLMPYLYDAQNSKVFFSAYHEFESLAEYFNQKLGHNLCSGMGDEQLIVMYKEMLEKDPNMTPKEMFEKAISQKNK